MADFNLGVALNADPSGFNNAMDNAAKKSADSFALIYDTAKQYLGMAGVAGTFAKAADAAGKFYQAVADIGAISGQTLEGVDSLLLGIDSRITTALGAANTMYEVFSSGIDGTNKEITELTEIIGKTANVIRADIMSTGDAMTTIMNAWGIAATDAKDIMDGLFITVREGKAHGDELARTFGLVTATASAMGTELDDLFAAVAILSRTQSSSQSMIGLNQMLNAIIKPTMEARAAAKKWGVEISATAIQTKGLAGVLRDLRDKVGGNVEALEAMFGNIRAGRAVLALTGTQFDEYIKVLDQMRGKSGSAEEAFKKQMDTMKAETERFKTEVTKAFITVGKDTEAVTTLLAKAGSSLLESFRSSSSGVGDFVSDINDLLGTTKRIPEELDKQIKYFSRWTLYLMGALRAYKGISDHFTKISSTLANIRGDMGGPTGGGDGKAPKTPRTPTSRFAKDTVAIDATDKALQRMTTTITTQVSPAVREVGAEFASIRHKVKSINTSVSALPGRINKAKESASRFKAAVKEANIALSATVKATNAAGSGINKAKTAITSVNTALTGTKSRLAQIITSQTTIKNGYKAHTAAITAANLALTRQIALLKEARASIAGGGTGTSPIRNRRKPATTAATGGTAASPKVSDAAGSYGSYEDRLYRDYVNSAIPNYSYENQLEREFFFGAGPRPKAVNNKRYRQRDSKGRFVSTIFPAPVSGGAVSLDAGFANVTNINTAPSPPTLTLPIALAPPLPHPRTPPLPPPLPVGPYAPVTEGFKALNKMDKDGIKIKNTGDVAKSITNAAARMPGFGVGPSKKFSLGDTGMEKAFNVLLMFQAAQMGYQTGKALDARFGVSDTLSDAWTGANVARAQQKSEGMAAASLNIDRIIKRDMASPTGRKLTTAEWSEFQRRGALATSEEARNAIATEMRGLIEQRTTPEEKRSEQLKLAQEAVDAAKKDLEDFQNRVSTAPESVITPSQFMNINAVLQAEAQKNPTTGMRKGIGASILDLGISSVASSFIPGLGAFVGENINRVRDVSKEARVKERDAAIKLVESKLASTGEFQKFYSAVMAGDIEGAGISGYSDYQKDYLNDLLASLNIGDVNKLELTELEEAKKVFGKKKQTELDQVKFVNSLDEMDDALNKAILDAGVARIDEYKGLGMENFTEASMENAQAIYDEARKALDEKTGAYNKRLDELKASGMPEAEIETTMADAKGKLNTAFTKLTTAEKGIYDAINRWQANLAKTILEAAEGASGISMNVMSRTDLSLGGKQLIFANTATEGAGLAYRKAKTDLKKLQDKLAQTAPDSPEAKKLQGRIEVQMGRVSAAERVFFGEQDKELNLNKNLTGRKINMFQMQMEQAEILKNMGKIGGAAYQDVQRTMLKNIESEARALYESASADYKDKGEDSIYSDLDILEFGVNLHRASEAVINFAKSLDNSRDRAQQAIMGGVQSFAGMKDPRGDLTATSLYHSINFMARLAPPERLLGSPTMPTGAVPEALNFKNATNAQASVARALDAYIMSQQYRQAGLATTVENIYSTLRSGSSIVVR